MPDFIKDGKGRGYSAEVDSQNMLAVAAVSVTKEHNININHENAYNFLFSQNSPAAGGCILYLKNESSENIVCEGIILRCASSEILTIKISENGIQKDGTDVIPANLNAGSNKLAIGEFQEGSDITGLSGGREVIKLFLGSSYIESKTWNFDADIVIPQNQTLTMYVTTGSIAIDGFLVFFHDHEN